jgi:hypothetical protein
MLNGLLNRGQSGRVRMVIAKNSNLYGLRHRSILKQQPRTNGS